MSLCLFFILEITEMLPGILNQLGAESLTHLKKLANNVTSQFKANEDDDVPGSFLKFACDFAIGFDFSLPKNQV